MYSGGHPQVGKLNRRHERESRGAGSRATLNRLDSLNHWVVFPEISNRVAQAGRVQSKVGHLEANGQRCGCLPLRPRGWRPQEDRDSPEMCDKGACVVRRCHALAMFTRLRRIACGGLVTCKRRVGDEVARQDLQDVRISRHDVLLLSAVDVVSGARRGKAQTVVTDKCLLDLIDCQSH